jgi:hypothetical protein
VFQIRDRRWSVLLTATGAISTDSDILILTLTLGQWHTGSWESPRHLHPTWRWVQSCNAKPFLIILFAKCSVTHRECWQLMWNACHFFQVPSYSRMIMSFVSFSVWCWNFCRQLISDTVLGIRRRIWMWDMLLCLKDLHLSLIESRRKQGNSVLLRNLQVYYRVQKSSSVNSFLWGRWVISFHLHHNFLKPVLMLFSCLCTHLSSCHFCLEFPANIFYAFLVFVVLAA